MEIVLIRYEFLSTIEDEFFKVRVTNQELMEFRETRANQDREYEESLAIDKEKVLLV